jgi:O-antigen/teichoic acid export membrane protein
MGNLETDSKFLKKAMIVNVVGTILKVCGPLLTFVMARIFGAAEFGIFVSAQTLLLTIAHSATLGLDKGLYWYLPQNGLQGRPRYDGIMESFWISAAISILCTAVIFVGSFTPYISKELPWYALSLLFYVGTYVFSTASEGNRRPQNAVFVNSFLTVTLAPATSIALHFMGIPHALPLGLLLGQVVGFCVHFVLVRRQFPDMPLRPHKTVSWVLLRYSLPLGVDEFVSSFLIRSSLWLVMLFLGPEKAGAYGIMVTISNALQTIRVGFTPILTPVVAGMDKGRLKTDLKPVYSYCVFMVTFIQLMIGFFIVLFPDLILGIAGKDFIVQPETLGILLLVHLVAGFGGMSLVVLNGMGKSLYSLIMDIVSLGVALVSGYLLIPAFGLVGAALSMLCYNIVAIICNNIYLLKMGLQPYSIRLLSQVGWIIALIAFYIAINMQVITLSMLQKAGIYVLILLALGAYGLVVKKKMDKDRNAVSAGNKK